MSNAYVLHRIIRRLAGWAVWSFFTEVHVIGEENVPKEGPIIVTATHHNMMLDPAILSSTFPHQRILHYWSKASLFGNPVVKYILLSSGNIPVDRKSKDQNVLFRGTFEALAKGLAVALFPEGTSYTEPRIMQVKDGAAWAAMEYTSWAQDNAELASPLPITIVPAAIVYTNKSKYRSSVIMEFGRPIKMDPYKEEFMSGIEGGPRAAIKRLTRAIESELIEATINSPDWDTLYAARMARDLLWEDHKSINLDEFVSISQTLVDLFSTTNATANFNSVKRNLLEYYSLLQTTELTNSVLSALPLPRTLDPDHPTPLPGRLRTLGVLVRDSISALARLPFFFFPLIAHMPIYILGRLGARLVEHEEETQAQNKVIIGLLFLLLIIYPLAFWILWALLLYTRTGAVLAAVTVWLFAMYHTKLINDNYEQYALGWFSWFDACLLTISFISAKRLVAAWRVLVGVWAPKSWDLPLTALSQYTTPATPPENPWIQKTKQTIAPPTVEEPPVTSVRKRRPPTRRVIRHVLRARAEAAKSLATFFDQLDKGDETKVKASLHLARAYGWVDNVDGAGGDNESLGWRHAREVLFFLRKRGAKVASLPRGIEGEWAALNSDGETSFVDGTENSRDEDVPSRNNG